MKQESEIDEMMNEVVSDTTFNCRLFMKWYRVKMYSQMALLLAYCLGVLALGLILTDALVVSLILVSIIAIYTTLLLSRYTAKRLAIKSAGILRGMSADEVFKVGNEFDLEKSYFGRVTGDVAKAKAEALSQSEKKYILNGLSQENIFREYLEN